jgi:hypothetical protein
VRAQVVEVLRREEKHSDAARELLAQLYLIFPAIVSAPSSSAAVPLPPHSFDDTHAAHR